MSFRALDHTADTGLEVMADGLAELFEEAAIGTMALMFDLDGWEPDGTAEVVGVGVDAGETLVAALSELLVEIELSDRVPIAVAVTACSPDRVVMRCRTAPLDRTRVVGPPIKAVTYHGLKCEPTATGWRARVYFDV